MDVNKENIEEYLLLLLDGELNEATAEEVMEFVESHAEYKLLLDEYLQARIEPDLIVFENKERLLKQEAIAMPLKKKGVYIAYAAAIAAIIGMSVIFEMLNQHKDKQEPSMALDKSGQPAIDTSFNQALVVKENKPKRTHKQIDKPLLVEKKDTVPENVVAAALVQRPKVDVLNSLPATDLKRMDIVTGDKTIVSEISVANAGAIPQRNISLDEMDDADPEKAAFFNSLLAQVEAMKNNVQKKAKSLRISTFSIQMGNKEFTIGK